MPGVSGNVWRAGKGRYSRNMGAEEKNDWGIGDRDPMTKSQAIQNQKMSTKRISIKYVE